jgi:general secretion pathway protein F
MIIALAAIDVVAVVVLLAVFQFVTRRQLRVYATVEHLAALARQNMPLHAGLRMVARDAGGLYGMRLERAAQAVEDGRPLGEALEESASALPPAARGMVRAGERSGNLAAFLEELARSYRALVDFHHRTAYVFVYPVVLSFIVFGVTLTLKYTIFPRFVMIAEQLRMTSPAGSLSVATILSEVTLAAAVLLVLAVYFGGASPWFSRSPFRRLIDRVILALPLVGRLSMDTSMRQFAFSCGLMVRRGAALPEAVRASAEAEPGAVMRERLGRVASAVEEGTRFSEAVRGAGLPRPLDWFIEAGEASGRLGETLVEAAGWFEARIRYAGHLATQSVVPAFVIANGVTLLAVWYSIFSPIVGALLRVIR